MRNVSECLYSFYAWLIYVADAKTVLPMATSNCQLNLIYKTLNQQTTKTQPVESIAHLNNNQNGQSHRHWLCMEKY